MRAMRPIEKKYPTFSQSTASSLTSKPLILFYFCSVSGTPAETGRCSYQKVVDSVVRRRYSAQNRTDEEY